MHLAHNSSSCLWFTCWWKDIVHENEDSLLGAQLDPLPNDVHKLTHSQVSRYQVPSNKAQSQHLQQQTTPTVQLVHQFQSPLLQSSKIP